MMKLYPMTHTLAVYASLAIISFLLHLIWERAHIRLYTGYDALKGKLPVFVYAAFGDVMYTLLAILLVALFKSDVVWFESARALDYLGLALLGAAIALFVEYKAFALKRWMYTSAMPIFPYLKVGLSPILQMTVLLPLSVCTTVALVLTITS